MSFAEGTEPEEIKLMIYEINGGREGLLESWTWVGKK